MTREEAIRCLSVHSSTNGSGLCSDKQHNEAKQMAIKALEQEPQSEWQHDHEILKAYSDGANEVLEKIRAEIEAEPYVSKMEVLDILDKYTAESAHDVAQQIVKNNGVVEL